MAVLELVHQLRPTAVTAALEHATEGVWIRHGRPSEPRERMFGEPGFELGGRQFCEGELAGGRRVQRHLGADPACDADVALRVELKDDLDPRPAAGDGEEGRFPYLVAQPREHAARR